ncbi:methionyl-tRNA formyltransferase [Candidatus Roizmanbacteria bacterium]|nr:methionyl-tRNA formyltransferase [Candidatus Roizmanbacteria bacterium]
MKKINLAFFGSPQFSADFLEKLLTDKHLLRLIEVKLIVTQPDSPIGRKQVMTPTPVKQVALKIKNLDIEDSLKTENFKLKISQVDLALIYFYGQIIPYEFLSKPKFGFWNIHFSALPKLRGPAPTAFSLVLGEEKTAISLVQTDEKIDHGDLVNQLSVKISPVEKRDALAKRLGDLSYDFTVNEIEKLSRGKVKLTPQDHSQSTYARFPTKEDGFIPLSVLKKSLKNEPLQEFEIPKLLFDYLYKYKLLENWKLKIQNSAKIIYDYFRGLYPWPGIWTLLPNGKRLKITEMKLDNLKNLTNLKLIKVQLEGKNEVDFETFNKAYKVFGKS